MTSISDRLRNPKFKFTAPQIQPNLNNSIYDYKPTQIKNFELSRAKYLDEDYKDGNKAKDFTPDRVKVLEDTGFSNISSVSFNEDPFASFFGMKTELVPDRNLDGYYQYNLKGMTDNKFIKDRMLQEGGNVTELESRIRDQTEFQELLEQRLLLEETAVDEAFDKERKQILTDAGDDDTEIVGNRLRHKKIEVQRAVRESTEMAGEKQKLDDYVGDLKATNPNKVPDDIAKLQRIQTTLASHPNAMSATKIRGLNNIYKKYNLPQITTAIKDNPDNVSNLMTVNRAKIRKYHSDIAEKARAESLARIEASKSKESTPRASAPVPSPALSLKAPAKSPTPTPTPIASAQIAGGAGGGGRASSPQPSKSLKATAGDEAKRRAKSPHISLPPVPASVSELTDMIKDFETVSDGKDPKTHLSDADVDKLKKYDKHFHSQIDKRSTYKTIIDKLTIARLEIGVKGSPLKAASKGATTPVGKSGAGGAKSEVKPS